MPEKSTHQSKGLYNSSLTRVYPLFERLIQRDPTGRSWLSNILQLAMDANPSALSLPKPIGSLLPEMVTRRRHTGRSLGYPYVEHIDLPACFEKSIPPSYRFLRWLIEHPNQLTWPNNGKERYGMTTQKNREELFGWHGADRQVAARKRALAALEQYGAERAQRKW